MAGSETDIGIKFEYDTERDLYVVYPCGHLRTPEDCRVWAEIVDGFYTKIGRPTDAVIVLDMLRVDPSVKMLYQQGRERITKLYLRHCIIVNCNPQLLDGRSMALARAHMAPDIGAAIAIIEAKRGSEVRRQPDLTFCDAAGAGTQTVGHPIVGVIEPEHGRGR